MNLAFVGKLFLVGKILILRKIENLFEKSLLHIRLNKPFTGLRSASEHDKISQNGSEGDFYVSCYFI
ncbi:hypothetical protein OBV_40310 [Oscillibacter valericigenes Sjm18-20]|nr:hypothetical protein OBV_40310 [Oscillibacter valericigenes Sjm18-20]